jgi:hypothetical protein
MSAQPHPDRPAREVIAPPHVSLRKEVGREAGPPPLEYGEVRLWLVAKGPNALFAYWEFRAGEHPGAIAADGRARFFLRIQCDATKTIESTIEIDPARGQCTTPAPRAGAPYHAELGFFNEQGVWCFLARSKPARTPPSANDLPSHSRGAAPDVRESSEVRPAAWTATQEAVFIDLLAADVAENAKPQHGSDNRGS